MIRCFFTRDAALSRQENDLAEVRVLFTSQSHVCDHEWDVAPGWMFIMCSGSVCPFRWELTQLAVHRPAKARLHRVAPASKSLTKVWSAASPPSRHTISTYPTTQVWTPDVCRCALTEKYLFSPGWQHLPVLSWFSRSQQPQLPPFCQPAACWRSTSPQQRSHHGAALRPAALCHPLPLPPGGQRRTAARRRCPEQTELRPARRDVACPVYGGAGVV